MVANHKWIDEEFAVVDQAARGEITMNELIETLSHRSVAAIGKKLGRHHLRALHNGREPTPLDPDDEGDEDADYDNARRLSAELGSAGLLRRILTVHGMGAGERVR